MQAGFMIVGGIWHPDCMTPAAEPKDIGAASCRLRVMPLRMSGAISEMQIANVWEILAAGWIVFVMGGPLGRSSPV